MRSARGSLSIELHWWQSKLDEAAALDEASPSPSRQDDGPRIA